MEDITDENSENYIPVEDRIATFDFDGTLYGELAPNYFEYMMLYHRIMDDPSYTPTASQIAVAEEIADNTVNGTSYDHLPISHAKAAAEAYAGMTMEEFDAYVKEYAKTEVDGFDNITYAEFYYQPMIQVIEYLQENDFTVYIVTGSDRFLSRSIADGVLDIASNNVIGMDVSLVATGQEYVDGLDYVFSPEDQLVRGDQLLIKNLKTNKVTAIAREIGKKPVLAFGNSSGDTSMLTYTISDNPYRSESFMLVADDAERDYANLEKANGLAEKWESMGYHVISMKNDFALIYKEGAVKNPEKAVIFDAYKTSEDSEDAA
jgi:phosphoserine phosphatase